MRPSAALLAAAALGAIAAPPPSVTERQLLDPVTEIQALIAALSGDASEGLAFFSDVRAILQQIQPTATPTSIPSALAAIESILHSNPGSLYATAAMFIEAGFGPADLTNLVATYSSGQNSFTNNNPRSPASAVYPKKKQSDAPYSLTEKQLREAIYIPSTYTYGQKHPVILVPGTATAGGFAFGSNIRKQLTGVHYADPVWLNVPGFELDDAQVNAEYVAYAINYLSGISKGQNVSVISWSQGSLDTQWALKYWPSTRKLLSDFIPVSPDYHGTDIAYALCPNFPTLPCDPSVVQQTYNSTFVATLRAGGGDSAYVPTTTLYSGFDEIVEPQQGKSASGYILDARGVGVSNNYVQGVCKGQPAGADYYDHETMLLNPLTHALIKDALTHPGPGRPSRIDKAVVCNQMLAPGHSLADLIGTVSTIPVAAVLLTLHTPKISGEPPIMPYAQ